MIRDNVLEKEIQRLLNYKGDVKTLSQWSRHLGINLGTLNKRIFINHWDIEKAFTTPVRKYK